MVDLKAGEGARYAIRCESETGVTLSSEMEVEAWTAIEALVGFLNRKDGGRGGGDLFRWKDGKSYLASARETYAWRAVIDSIKENDLALVGREIEAERRKGDATLPPPPSAIMRSKPIMLRVAGEVTNALIHSYNNRHAIAFVSV